MVRGRRAGLLHKTLNELAEDWLDKRFDARRRIGTAGTTVMEQADHLAASAVFGAAYGRCDTIAIPHGGGGTHRREPAGREEHRSSSGWHSAIETT
jgi:hypothetical protein